MKIIFTKNIGFCSGVKRAIEIAEISLKEDPKPIQFLGNLVHNELVMKALIKKGGKIISDPGKIHSSTAIIRAHGISSNLREKIRKNILIRDATCPKVKLVQEKAKSFLKKGYQVIIFGDRKHPEVKGIKAETKEKAIVVENERQAKEISKFKKIGLVAQTTQNLYKFNKILKILKQKAKKIEWLNTICPEVITRQKELDMILKKCDGILVIGSRSSDNTKRLVEKVKKFKKRVFWIDSLEELKTKKLKGISKLGVVSGTSTPDWEIKRIRKWLKDGKQK